MKAEKINALERQRQVYVNGLSGIKPLVPVDMDKLAQKAAESISKEAYAYIATGASRELTVASNRNAFQRWEIIPRMLKNVSNRDTSTEIFSTKIQSPIVLSPVGVLEMAHKEADTAVGKAAASLGIPFIFSNQASIPMESVAKTMGDAPKCFQLYWSKSNELVASLVKRAESCGCRAIVVTLDTFLLGWRTRDLDLAFLPFMEGMGIANYTSDPVFNRLLDEPKEQALAVKPKVTLTTIEKILKLNRRYPGGFFKNIRSGRALAGVKQFVNIYSRDTLTWKDLSFLRKQTKLPIYLKGILHPNDAKMALEEGIDGLIVSNHGGRQVDGSISTLAALPKIAEVIQKQIPIIMDSGIRSGADIFKAIALGADAVGIGRPYVYGLAIAGEAGVREVLINLMADFELNMALAGCTSLEDITKDCLVSV